MTNDEIRVAVAEACGWVKVRAHWEKDGESAFLNDSIHHLQLPNYPADLNACHEMEKTLTPEEEQQYVERLGGLLMSAAYEDDPRWLRSELSSGDSTYRATARQRCEAFLKVKGLWKP